MLYKMDQRNCSNIIGTQTQKRTKLHGARGCNFGKFFPLNFQHDLAKFALERAPVKIDWAQNIRLKQIIAVFSLREIGQIL